MSYLEMKDVSFTYSNGYEAIKDVSMSFDKGESIAIIGQNGAGKTTTVKLMNGLLKPSKGKIILDGEDTLNKTTATISRKVGYVFQNPDDQIFQDTIYKEIAFGLKGSKSEIENKVLKAATLCHLNDSLSEHPYNLPYSKRKFVTIAAIIAMDTQVVILDEPTAGQDRKSTELLGNIIKCLTEENKTVITITHDMDFVSKEFERVIVFSNKKKRADSNPETIFWNEELLKMADLQQPYVFQIAKLKGIRGVSTIEELVERCK
ncbi:MAG: ABC transporter ATP-binding protein [Vagococcus sp.]